LEDGAVEYVICFHRATRAGGQFPRPCL
jgi:hypothetical protein